MNTDQILSSVRTLLKIAGTILVTKGVTDSATAEAVIGAFLTLLGIYLSHAFHADLPNVTISSSSSTVTTSTNASSPDATETTARPPSDNRLSRLLLLVICPLSLVIYATGCAVMTSTTSKQAGVETTTLKVYTLFDSSSALSKAANHVTDKTSGTTVSGLDQSSSSTNLNSIVESIVGAAVKAATK